MRVALLGDARELGDALPDAEVVRARGCAPVEALLRRRGFTASLTSIPSTVAALARGGFDVAHAFTPPDAVAALAWRRLTGRPVVFTCAEVLGRERLADRRLRLWSLERALRDADAVLAGSEEARLAMERWLAVDAPVLDPRDAAAHERLYRELLARA